VIALSDEIKLGLVGEMLKEREGEAGMLGWISWYGSLLEA
jgi:hypothetical protein